MGLHVLPPLVLPLFPFGEEKSLGIDEATSFVDFERFPWRESRNGPFVDTHPRSVHEQLALANLKHP